MVHVALNKQRKPELTALRVRSHWETISLIWVMISLLVLARSTLFSPTSTWHALQCSLASSAWKHNRDQICFFRFISFFLKKSPIGPAVPSAEPPPPAGASSRAVWPPPLPLLLRSAPPPGGWLTPWPSRIPPAAGPAAAEPSSGRCLPRAGDKHVVKSS